MWLNQFLCRLRIIHVIVTKTSDCFLPPFCSISSFVLSSIHLTLSILRPYQHIDSLQSLLFSRSMFPTRLQHHTPYHKLDNSLLPIFTLVSIALSANIKAFDNLP